MPEYAALAGKLDISLWCALIWKLRKRSNANESAINYVASYFLLHLTASEKLAPGGVEAPQVEAIVR